MPQILKSILSIPKWLTASILACLFYVAVLPYNEAAIFILPYESPQALRVASALKLLFLPVLLGVFYFILNFIQRLFSRDHFYRSWLKMTLIYGGIMLLFFLLLYPGHWVGDEFDILEAVRRYSLYSWQNYLTNIYYTFSLYLIPSGVGIVIVQLTLLSLIVGYITALAKKLFTKKYTPYLLLVPLIFFPVILNNFYPLRLTIFSYLLLLLITQLVFLHLKVLSPSRPRLFFLQVSLIIAVVCFWRSEGILYLSLLPFFAHALGLFNESALRQASTYATYTLSACFIGLMFAITNMTTRDTYQITATLNPLSTMIQGRLEGKNSDKDLEAINKVVDLEIVKRYPSYDEIPSFWNGAVREDYYHHLNNYNSHVYSIFLNNPATFLSNRFQVFLRTNSFGTYPSLGISQFYNPDPLIVQKVQNFHEANDLSKPLSLRLKLAVTKRLLLVDDQYRPGTLTKLAWSVIPTVITLVILLMISALKRKWLYATIAALLLLHTVIIFLTAPASYFMYYFPVYLVGNFMLVMLALRIAEKKILKISSFGG